MKDAQGLGVEVVMLLKSLEPGRYATYMQFASTRKLRSAYSNAYMASSHSLIESVSLKGTQIKLYLVKCPT
eukprot:6764143-Ditylum_brightwellii.AAC.1